jgi:3-oxoacyl-[acyl-carrier-protein] synthase III
MATTLSSPAVTTRRWSINTGARKLADKAALAAIAHAGLDADDIGLLVNTGLYHDRILSEPALAALIQEDVGSHPEDPHAGAHGTFSFDVANGACGVLTALQVADGFLRAGTIDHALIVASDADPGRGTAPGFPFAGHGAAVVCHWEDGPTGIAGFRWDAAPQDDRLFRARVGFEDGHNVLRVEQDPDFGTRAAALAGETASALLDEHGTKPIDVDLVVANPLMPGFLEGLSEHVGIEAERVVTVEGAEHAHTAGLLVALDAAEAQGRLRGAHRILLVSAGAGIITGAAILLR